MTPGWTEVDPLAPALLPGAPWEFPVSTDLPSGPATRPFGLTRTSVVPESQREHVTGIRYDSQSQLTVTADGGPLVHSPFSAVTTTSRTTTRDMQHWNDYDPDDESDDD